MTNNSTPLISVAIGTHNGSKCIEQAINSILNQTYQSFEIIVCDDCSTDNTVTIIKSLMTKDNRIHLLQNPVNVGLNITLNNCIEASHGSLIARMDDDDVSHPERFERQIAYLNEHPEIAFVGTSKRYFDEHGCWGQAIAKVHPSIKDIFTSHAFSHPTVIIRKEALTAVGNYSSDKLNRRGQDYDLWCKLYKAGYRGANLSDILFDYYESRGSVKRRKLKFRIDHIRKELFWRKELQLPVSYLRFPLMDLIKCFMPDFFYLKLRKLRFK